MATNWLDVGVQKHIIFFLLFCFIRDLLALGKEQEQIVGQCQRGSLKWLDDHAVL